MTEIVSSQDDVNTHSHSNVSINPRHRIGQARAPKRSIVDYKNHSNRSRRSQKVDGYKSNKIGTEKETKPKPIPLTPAPNRMHLALQSPPDVETQASVRIESSEHKRHRPEATNSPIPCGLSSSAPPASTRLNPTRTLLFEAIDSDLQTTGRSKYFVCSPSLLDEQRLEYLLSREAGYYPNNAFLYYVNPEVEDKVDATLRNEAVHNLRFMHNAFFNLPTEIFCKAVNLIDRFIVKVKVKPKYMACVATASYCVASKFCSSKDNVLPDLETIVHIARCGGNAADLIRMEEILASKLSNDLDGVNAFDFVQLFTRTLLGAEPDSIDAADLLLLPPCAGPFGEPDKPGERNGSAGDQSTSPSYAMKTSNKSPPNVRRVQWMQLMRRLMTRLEIALCSLEVYRFRPVCLALSILAQMNVRGLGHLANRCGVDWTDIITCASLVEDLYHIYYRDPLPYTRRPLIWALSRRTALRIGYSSPTPLDTITEDCEPTEESEWPLPLLFEP